MATVDLDIIDQRPVLMAEVKTKVEALKKVSDELNFRANRVLEYVNVFVELKEKDLVEKKKAIEGIGLSRLNERHIIKILDIMPQSSDDLKILLTGENITLKQEDLNKVIEVIKA